VTCSDANILHAHNQQANCLCYMQLILDGDGATNVVGRQMSLKCHLLRPPQVFSLYSATYRTAGAPLSQRGLHHTRAAKPFVTMKAGADSGDRSLAIRECDDEPGIRKKYRPFLLDKEDDKADWVDDLGLDTVTTMAAENMQRTGGRLKVLVLYGSLRQRLANRRVIRRVSSLPVKREGLMILAGHTQASQRSKLLAFSSDLAVMSESMILPACRSKMTYSTNMRRYKSCAS